MCEIEVIVNSRPITEVSDDPRDIQPLMPNQFLLPRNGPQLPPGAFTSDEIHASRRWRQVKHLSDTFLGDGCGNTFRSYNTTKVVSQEKKLRSWWCSAHRWRQVSQINVVSWSNHRHSHQSTRWMCSRCESENSFHYVVATHYQASSVGGYRRRELKCLKDLCSC